MGVDISSLIDTREIELIELSGRKVAFDAYNIIYQFLSIIRDRMTGEPLRDSNGRVTSHLSGLLYRNSNLIEAGIKPVFVFDGEPPEFKESTISDRAKRKKEAREKWKKAVERGERAIKYAQATSKVTDDIVNSSKVLLDCMGIPWIQAPSEGELQCAFMCKEGDVWTTGSQDYDSLLAGSPRLARNLSITGKRKVPKKDKYVQINPELIDLEKNLEKLGITQPQLVIMGILIGTDYSDGVKGVGPKTALNLVKEYKTIDVVMDNVEWDSDVPADTIYDFFLNPPVKDDYELKWNDPDFDRLTEFMVEEHDFSEKRMNNVIERLNNAMLEGRQSSLSGWLEK